MVVVIVSEVLRPVARHIEGCLGPAGQTARVVRVQLLAEEAVGAVFVQVVVDVDPDAVVGGVDLLIVQVEAQALELNPVIKTQGVGLLVDFGDDRRVQNIEDDLDSRWRGRIARREMIFAGQRRLRRDGRVAVTGVPDPEVAQAAARLEAARAAGVILPERIGSEGTRGAAGMPYRHKSAIAVVEMPGHLVSAARAGAGEEDTAVQGVVIRNDVDLPVVQTSVVVQVLTQDVGDGGRAVDDRARHEHAGERHVLVRYDEVLERIDLVRLVDDQIAVQIAHLAGVAGGEVGRIMQRFAVGVDGVVEDERIPVEALALVQ